MPQTIKAENYVNIQGWMITELGLKNAELMIYALIYGFSQDKRSAFTGSISYLQEWTQASRPTVHAALNSLREQGLIARCDVIVGGAKAIGYYALPREDKAEEQPEPDDDGCKKILHDCKKTLHGVLKNLTPGVKNFNTDNNIDNIDINNKQHAPSAEADDELPSDGGTSPGERLTAAEIEGEFAEIWKRYPRKQGREDALSAYANARRTGTSRETIAAGVDAYNAKIDAEQIPMRYVVQGGNWFAGRRWEDDNTPSPLPDGEKRRNRALTYPQHEYTAEELKAFGIDLGEDLYKEE